MKNLIAILGGGESGAGAALLAQAKGYRAFLSDQGSIAEKYKAKLLEAGVGFEEGGHTLERILEASEAVVSPGIPEKAAVVQALRQKGVPVLSEVEFAARFTTAKIVGITGSNGKTTTTRLTHHLLLAGGLDARMAGNVGNSFAAELLAPEAEYYVLELSSFQLDNIARLRPFIAVLLNITPDHLDRYDYKMENYVAAKMKIAQNQTQGDYFLYNADDEYIAQGMEGINIRAQRRPLPMDTGVEGSPLRVGGHDFDMQKGPLRGRHNRFNAQCAIEAALLLGVQPEAIQRGLDTFVNTPHRLERAGEWNGVLFLNDSKATNVDAVYYALEAMDRPVVWIAGGTDKGNDYAPLMPFVREKVRALICMGADNAKLIEVFGGVVPELTEAKSAAEAVAQAARLAKKGDVVLLSPACASFDLFRNYEDRGDQFKRAVKELLTSTVNS
jgi:UDP-N-acetylmuramoylalanine--D-glutamate ligase